MMTLSCRTVELQRNCSGDLAGFLQGIRRGSFSQTAPARCPISVFACKPQSGPTPGCRGFRRGLTRVSVVPG